MTRILLADDDIELTAMLTEYLVGEGFIVDSAADGQLAVKTALEQPYDVIVLDVMMPRLNGYDVLRAVRQKLQTPILMLTARGEDVDSILGLELGADDYLAKPCNPRVLVARIRALLRRSQHEQDTSQPQLVNQGDLQLNSGSRTVTVNGVDIVMTSTEFSILERLLREAGSVVAKNTLSEQALGRALGRFDRSLDMHISNLRHKLGPLPDGNERIKTVRGVGYQYVVN